MAKRDLTLWEVDEAKNFGLSAENYDELKTILEGRWRKNYITYIQENIKTETLKTARPKIKEEVKAEIIADLTSNFEETKKQEIRKLIEKEMASTIPTVEQKIAAKEMAYELELDCQAIAKVASDSADAELSLFQDLLKVRNGIFYTFLFSYLPVLAYLHTVQNWNLTSIPFLAAAITQLVAIIYSGISNEDWKSAKRNRIEKYKKASTEYWNLANQAKEVRIVKVNTSNTKGELNTLIQNISSNKYGYGKDFQPSAVLLEKARAHVRDSQIGDMDINKFIRSEEEQNLMDKSRNLRVMEQDPLEDDEIEVTSRAASTK